MPQGYAGDDWIVLVLSIVISQYLQNLISFDEMKNKLNTAIHQFAKRQETWFRRMERKGIGIKWIQANEYDLLKESVIKLFP